MTPMTRSPRLLSLALLLPALAAPALAVEDYALAQFEPLYESEAILPERIATQYQEVPANQTWVRIRHMGDQGTDQLTQQAANPVASDRSQKTGLFIPEDSLIPRHLFQRGFEDRPALGTNVYQVYGHGFGWHVNTFRFAHEGPIECPELAPECQGGPNIDYGRTFDPPLDPWPTPSSELTLQVRMSLPFAHHGLGAVENPPAAQVSFLYYLVHPETGYYIAGLVNLFDSRPFERVGQESVGSDNITAFVSSDLRDAQPDGQPYRYVTRSPYSSISRNRWAWQDERFFRAHVSRENLANLLADANAPGVAEDYRLYSASILIEAFPEQTGDISLAGSLRKFSVYRAHDGD